MKIVLDTNILVSGLLSPYGNPAKIIRMVSSGELQLCIDSRILTEYTEVLKRPKFQFDEAKVEALLEEIESQGEIVATGPLQKSLPDPDDDMFLEVAIESQADCLITGNLNHYPKELCASITVLSPSEFIKNYKEK